MSNDAQDIAVARYAREIGLAAPKQLAEAMKIQAADAEGGTRVSLSEVLVRMGILTSAQKEMIEKKAASKHGVQQLGRFKLVRKLGEGGMGMVYLAEDLEHSGKVALKVLPRRFSDKPEFLSRFRREAEAAATLRHENIVGAHEAGEDLGYHFYVMEFCEGETLDRTLLRRKTLPADEAIPIALQAARGLQAAHERGFIHRDIKPSNLIITPEGCTKILDLGLTKNLEGDESSFRTLSGTVLGTPHYMSPEQAKSEKNLDGRTDLYSLGATLYHAVTGEAPFRGETPLEILFKHVNEQLPNPQDLNEAIPDPVVHVIRKMMAKAPDDRYRNAGELIDDLKEVSEGRPPRSGVLDPARSAVALVRKRGPASRRRPTLRRTRTEVTRRKNVLLWGGIAGAVALAAIAALLMTGGEPENVTAVKPSPAPPPVTPARPAPVDREQEASRSLKELLRFDGIPRENRVRRKTLLEAFIRKYDGTFAASEARAHLKSIKAPPPVTLPPTEADWIRSVAAMAPAERVRAVVAKLEALNPGLKADPEFRVRDDRVHSLTLSPVRLKDLSPLRALQGLRNLTIGGRSARPGDVSDLSPLQGMQLEELYFPRNKVTDLSSLKDLPLDSVDCSGMEIRDLSPLRGKRLVYLNCHNTLIADLSPLTGMPLETLTLFRTRVSDLGPLRGMPLVELSFQDTRVTDLAPLKGMTLKKIACDIVPGRDVEILRSMPRLERINFEPAADFWKDNPAGPAPPAEPPRTDPADVIWTLLMENQGKLAGKTLALERPGLKGAQFKVLSLSTNAVELEARLPGGGGTARMTESRNSLPGRALVELLRVAVPKPAPELRKDLVLLLLDKEEFDTAYGEIDRARRAGVALDEEHRRVLAEELKRIEETPDEGDKLALLRKMSGRRSPPVPAKVKESLQARITALEEARKPPPPGSSKGLVARWAFDEGTGTVARNASGRGLAGKISGAAWSAGVSGNALAFDGADDYVDLGAVDLGGTALTLSAWIRLDPNRRPDYGDWRILSKTTGMAEQDHYWMLSGDGRPSAPLLRFRLKTDGSTATLIADSGTLAAGSWIHVAAVYDGTRMRLYKDGIEVGSMAKSGRIDVNPSVNAWIGGNPPRATEKPFRGKIDEVRLYRRALTPAEIVALSGRRPR